MTTRLESNQMQNNQYLNQQSKTQKNSDGSFDTLLTNAVVPNFKEMWQERFPNAYYHILDASKIPQENWQRNDYPFEKFFAPNLDESVLTWQPSGVEPQMSDASVQSRMDSILGQNAVVVPKELEEKLKNNPQLAKEMMQKIDSLFAQQGFVSTPNTSALIVFDENGNIARFRLTSGGRFSVSSDEFVQAAKKRKQEQDEARQAAEVYANEQALVDYLAKQKDLS